MEGDKPSSQPTDYGFDQYGHAAKSKPRVCTTCTPLHKDTVNPLPSEIEACSTFIHSGLRRMPFSLEGWMAGWLLSYSVDVWSYGTRLERSKGDVKKRRWSSLVFTLLFN